MKRKNYIFTNTIIQLEEFLIYGMYPEIVTSSDKKRLLLSLAGSYLYKDILELANIKKPDLLIKLNILDLQLGKEVSYN